MMGKENSINQVACRSVDDDLSILLLLQEWQLVLNHVGNLFHVFANDGQILIDRLLVDFVEFRYRKYAEYDQDDQRQTRKPCTNISQRPE